jgi:hypothetical protein
VSLSGVVRSWVACEVAQLGCGSPKEHLTVIDSNLSGRGIIRTGNHMYIDSHSNTRIPKIIPSNSDEKSMSSCAWALRLSDYV